MVLFHILLLTSIPPGAVYLVDFLVEGNHLVLATGTVEPSLYAYGDSVADGFSIEISWSAKLPVGHNPLENCASAPTNEESICRDGSYSVERSPRSPRSDLRSCNATSPTRRHPKYFVLGLMWRVCGST